MAARWCLPSASRYCSSPSPIFSYSSLLSLLVLCVVICFKEVLFSPVFHFSVTEVHSKQVLFSLLSYSTLHLLVMFSSLCQRGVCSQQAGIVLSSTISYILFYPILLYSSRYMWCIVARSAYAMYSHHSYIC